MGFTDGKQSPARIVAGALVVQFIGLADGSAVKHVGPGQPVISGKFVIEPSRKVILRRYLLPREGVNPSVPRSEQSTVR